MTQRSLRRTTLLPLLALALLAGCSRPAARPEAAPASVSGLTVATVRLETIPDEVEAPGTVVAKDTATIAARTMGTVEQVLVREGDRVRPGELLLSLEASEAAARLRAAEAGLAQAAAGREAAARAVASARAQADLAQKTYQRYLYLREQKSVSPQEFDEVAAKEKAARAGLAQAQAGRREAEAAYARARQDERAAAAVRDYARIVAPFAGVVVERYVDPGSMAVPGAPLLRLDADSGYRLEATLEAAAASGIRRGTAARVRLDALGGKEFRGRVVEFEAGADPATHTVRVKVALPHDPALRSGLFGRAWFERGTRQAMVVPASAAIARGQLRGVFTVDATGIAHWRLVTLGRAIGNRLEVLSGLSEGDRIVVDPAGRALDGVRVEAAK
jgi:multidrug efflux system membrane fusion protein